MAKPMARPRAKNEISMPGFPSAVPRVFANTPEHKKPPPAGQGLAGRRAPKRCGARPYPDPRVCWACPWTIRRRTALRYTMCGTSFPSLLPGRAYRSAVQGSSHEETGLVKPGCTSGLHHLLTIVVASGRIGKSSERRGRSSQHIDVCLGAPGTASWRSRQAPGTGHMDPSW